MTAMMGAELTHFLGREPYARSQGDVNHRNGSYGRAFTLKNIGEVEVKIPRDRKGEFTTQVIPRSKQYEEEISRDLSLMFLSGISTRSLSMISQRLIGRKISHTEISSANADLTEAVEKWRMRDLSKESIKYIFVDGVNFRRLSDAESISGSQCRWSGCLCRQAERRDTPGPTYPYPLYYPHIASVGTWETEICVINASDTQTINGTFKAYNDSGTHVSEDIAVTLAPHGRREITVGNEFTDPSNIGYIIFESDSDAVEGYTKFYVEHRFSH